MDTVSEIVYIGIGSNLSDPYLQVKKAIQSISNLPQVCHIQTSQYYLTSPVGEIEQPDFINAVIEMRTSLSPLALLACLQAIEEKQGREKRSPRWGPRIIDLDILLYGKERVDLPQLKIPHPELLNRWFVLLPLLEITPYFYLPE